jgi:N-acetylglucosamine-6-phosphate deacetylase
MTTDLLYHANILTSTQVIEHGAVAISDGIISYVGPMENAPRADGLKMDLCGKYLAPGFFDVHVHGGKGVSFGSTDGPLEELEAYSKWAPSTGVTHYLCSLAAPDARLLAEKTSLFADVLEAGVKGAQPLGLHLEGPFINKKRKGAFNPDWLREPSLEEAESFLKAGRGWIRQMTMAPELKGALEIAARFRAEGVVVSMGHTDADFETARAALKGNFTHVTHAFNAQSGFHQRQPGVFGALLASDEVTAELIADTIHVHPGAMLVLLRCLGTDRVVLITDAMPGAGLPDGIYDLVGLQVTVKNGHANLPDGTIAGSTAMMNQCVYNIHHRVGVPLPEAVKMASLNPARVMGFADRLGNIAVGKEANLVVIDEDIHVYLTLVKGTIVYNNL